MSKLSEILEKVRFTEEFAKGNLKSLSPEDAKTVQNNKKKLLDAVKPALEDALKQHNKITARITSLDIDSSNKIYFETAELQTNFKLFKKLVVKESTSFITKVENTDIFNVQIVVNFRYNLFEGGSNGTTIGSLFMQFDKDFNLLDKTFIPVEH